MPRTASHLHRPGDAGTRVHDPSVLGATYERLMCEYRLAHRATTIAQRALNTRRRKPLARRPARQSQHATPALGGHGRASALSGRWSGGPFPSTMRTGQEDVREDANGSTTMLIRLPSRALAPAVFVLSAAFLAGSLYPGKGSAPLTQRRGLLPQRSGAMPDSSSIGRWLWPG